MDSNELHSHSSDLDKTLRRFFIPSLVDFIVYLVLGAILLLVLNHQAISNLLHADTLTPTDVAHLVFSTRFELIGTALNHPIFGRLSLLLFWAFIGCVTYMVLWLVQYLLTTAREDYVEGQQYVHPKTFNKSSYWQSIIAHNIFLFSAIVVFLGFAYLSLRMFLPMLSKLFYVGLLTAPALVGFADLILSILLISFVLYFSQMLWRVLRSAWHMNSIPTSS